MKIATNGAINIIDDETSIVYCARIVAISGDTLTIEIEGDEHDASFDDDEFAWRIGANDDNGWSCDLLIAFGTHASMYHDV